MPDMPLRDFLLATKGAVPDGPGVDHLKAEFATRTRHRCYRALSWFQWTVLAFYTVLTVDVWVQERSWGVAVSWVLLALLAIVGPKIWVSRLARCSIQKQVRLAGQVEALSLFSALVLVPTVAFGLLSRTTAIEMPSVGWLIAVSVITAPSLAWLFRGLARALARRFDPEWWE